MGWIGDKFTSATGKLANKLTIRKLIDGEASPEGKSFLANLFYIAEKEFGSEGLDTLLATGLRGYKEWSLASQLYDRDPGMLANSDMVPIIRRMPSPEIFGTQIKALKSNYTEEHGPNGILRWVLTPEAEARMARMADDGRPDKVTIIDLPPPPRTPRPGADLPDRGYHR